MQFSPLTDWVVRRTRGHDSAETLPQSFLQEAIVNSSGTGRDVHSLVLSIQHFLCQPRCRPPSKVPEDGSGEAVVECDMPSCPTTSEARIACWLECQTRD